MALPLINRIITIVSAFALKMNTNSGGILSFLLFVGISIPIYFGITYGFDRHLGYRMLSFIKQNLSSLRGTWTERGSLSALVTK